MGQKLEDAGYPDMSSAVRPMALSPDERYVYFQVSFFHGFVEYDLQDDRVLRLARLPLSEEAARLRRDEYVLDSAHHGLTMNPEGTKLCAAGTMSDYAAIVSRATFGHRIVPVGEKPYWTTNSGDGRHCFVSVSGDDLVVGDLVRDRGGGRAHPVGDHPQRMRMGRIATAALAALPPAHGEGARKPRLRVRVRPRRVRAGRPVTLRVRVTARRGGARVPVRGARVRRGGQAREDEPQGPRAAAQARTGSPSRARGACAPSSPATGLAPRTCASCAAPSADGRSGRRRLGVAALARRQGARRSHARDHRQRLDRGRRALEQRWRSS